jgi:ABC-type multidrug transport system fused ATPase/permease subunit
MCSNVIMYVSGFLNDFFKAQPLTVLTNLSFAFLYPVQDVALPHFYGQLIESLTQNRNISKNIVFVLATFIAVEIGFIISDWHDIKTISSFQTFCRQEILKNIMKKYETEYSDLFIGDIMSKLVKIPYTVVVWYERLKQYIIPYVLVFGFAVCYFGSYDKVLGVALLVTSVVYAAVVAGVPQVYCSEASTAKDQMMNQIHEEIDDTLRNFIAMHGDTRKQNEEVQRLEQYEELFTARFAETMACLMKTKGYTSIIIVLFITVFILRSYVLLRAKKLSTSSFSSLFLILVYVLNCMLHLEGQLRDMIFDWGVLYESDDLFNKSPRQTSRVPRGVCDVPKEKGIGMRHVAFTFQGGGQRILEDITFHIKPEETVVILGDIGSGKSTILKILLNFNQPDSGCAYIDGKAYHEMDIKEVKRRVGYVPQQPILFNRSVHENITYGTEGVTRERVEMFLKEMGVDNEFTNLENGLDTKIGKNGSKLSGGQRQLVWTIRTYFQNPDVIILDEPTASLDEKSKVKIKMLLSVMMKHKTVIIVTHDDSLLELANRRLYVEKGRIVEKKGENEYSGNPIHASEGRDAYMMRGGLLNF